MNEEIREDIFWRVAPEEVYSCDWIEGACAGIMIAIEFGMIDDSVVVI